jgi:hypothetical protein
MSRATPNVVIERSVRNQSSRSLAPTLIVIHDTESHERPGNADLAAIGDWFDNPAAQASAHVCTDGDGNSARYVPDASKAWACVEYNSASLNIEQIGFASDPRASWLKRRNEIKETARWVAQWSKTHGIPIRRARVSDGRVLRSGVATHNQLGQPGGGHHDPGGHYPLRIMLAYARAFRRRL